MGNGSVEEVDEVDAVGVELIATIVDVFWGVGGRDSG